MTNSFPLDHPAARAATKMTSIERRGRAMGSTMHLIASGPSHLLEGVLDRAKVMIADLERLWSRFDPTSEISRLNAAPAGLPFPVSPHTALLVRRGIEAWYLSDGLFDPSMLRAVIEAGYDRPFDQLPSIVTVPGLSTGSGPGVGGGCDDIVVGDNTVSLPPGLAFDPGGLGKGLAADLVAEAALEWGADGVVINLGGDLRCAGVADGHGTWTVALPTFDKGDRSMIELAGGGIATSSCLRRRWTTPGGEAHHLIDPATGRPAPLAARSVTVLAATACDAETLATAIATRGALPVNRSMLGGAVVVVTDASGNRWTHGPIEEFQR